MPRVLLLHGLGADRRAFQRFLRLLPATWDAVAIDLLGHGDAQRPPSGYRLEHHAAWVAQDIERRWGSPDHLPDHPPVLVGHSYGAATSVAVAAIHPHLVSAIVLLDPVVHLAAGQEHSGTGRMIAAKRAGRLTEQVAAMYPDASDALKAWTVSTWERMAHGVVDELDPDWMRLADRVQCPVTVIHGDLDQGGAGDVAADWFADPAVTRIAGAGHYLHATHARATAAAVIEAVDRDR